VKSGCRMIRQVICRYASVFCILSFAVRCCRGLPNSLEKNTYWPTWKPQSPTTVLFRTTLTRTITLYELLILLGSSHLLCILSVRYISLTFLAWLRSVRFLLLTLVRLNLKKQPCHRSTCVSIWTSQRKVIAMSYSKASMCRVVGWAPVTWIIASCPKWWRCEQLAWHYQHTSLPTTVAWTRLNRWGWGDDNSTCGEG